MKSKPDSKITAEYDRTTLPNDILIVDDEIPNLKLLSDYLGRAGFHVRATEKPQLAIDSALKKPPALILLDVRMPEMNGFEVCKRLKLENQTRGIPVIFISALQEVQDRVKGFEIGGVDFISKPFQEEEVLARVRTHVELRNMQLYQEKIIAERTEESLETEQRFRATFEQAAVGIAHVSPEGRFLRINKKFCNIVGYTENEMLGMTFQDITHPDDLHADLDYVRQVLKGEIKTYSMDKRYYCKDGSIVWTNLTVSMVHDIAGRPDYFVSVVMDISDRIKAEEALRQNRDFLQHLTSAVPDAIFSVKMPERKIKWANDSFNVMGYEPEEYIGQSTEKYYANPEDYETVGRLQQEAILKGDSKIRTEIRVLRKDGRVIPAELTATYYREGEKLSQITAFIRDISERKWAEKNLARSEAKYRGLVDNSLVGVFTSTLDGRFVFVNNAMARMFDFDSPEPMIAKGSIERWRDINDRKRLLNELKKHGKVTNFEAETITHTGRHMNVLFSAKQLGDNIVGMIMDITKRKKAEQKIIAYQQRLKALASQLTIVEEKERRAIAADLHDDVGQALALARMQIAAIRKKSTDRRQIATLDELSDSLQQTVRATRNLMYDLSPPQLNEIGLAAALSEWLTEHVEKHHPIKATCIVNGPEKQIDETMRAILFRNIRELVTNVVKHSQATKVQITLDYDDDLIRVSVRDDGIGFDIDDASQTMQMTNGFGLFSIRERMSDMGGSLEIISSPGMGTEAILHAQVVSDDSQARKSS